jgi:hypothetical protein
MKHHTTVNIHSFVDVITNSSTEIFVSSENTLTIVKEVLVELLKVMGSDKTVDEVFDIKLKCINVSYVLEYLTYMLETDDVCNVILNSLGKTQKEHEKTLERLITNVKNKKVEAPDWFKKYNVDYNVQTKIEITSKDDKYTHLLDLLIKFLYSPHYFEHSTE